MVNRKKKMKIKIYNSPFTIFNLLLSKKNLQIAENEKIMVSSPFFMKCSDEDLRL